MAQVFLWLASKWELSFYENISFKIKDGLLYEFQLFSESFSFIFLHENMRTHVCALCRVGVE